VVRVFPKTLGLSFGGVVIVLFALMTGGSATLCARCLMGTLCYPWRYLQRRRLLCARSLAAVVVMVLWNPLSTLYDPSFILSVLATFD